MKHIKSFKVFESQNELEFLNETRFYFLTNFHKAISKAPSEFSNICRDLLDLYGEEIDDDITFVDLEDKNLSYTTQKNVNKEYPEFIDGLKSDNLIWIPTSKMREISPDLLDSKTRSRIKIGRFLNKVINTPKKYPESLIDKFVVYLQSQSGAKEEYKFKVVKGNEIAKYYDSFNYARMKGTLGNSCMNDKQQGRSDRTDITRFGSSTTYGFKGTNNLFDIYTKNPEVCSLLVMLDSSNKLVARAFIWDAEIRLAFDIKENLTDLKGKIKFLDRVYSTEDWMVYSMTKWAKENGMATRLNQGLGSQEYIEYKGNKYDVEMEVNVKKIYYGAFPYLDTFSFYDVKAGKLLNYSGKNGLGLQSASGNYGIATGYSPRVRNFIRRFK
jgi:hypothetical protein